MRRQNNFLEFGERLDGVRCTQGYEPYDEYSLRCSETGMFNTEILTCTEAECRAILTQDIPHIYPYSQCDRTPSGDSCQIFCDTGYTHQGATNYAQCYQGEFVNLADIECVWEDPCQDVICYNNGTCNAGYCDCTSNFYGTDCSREFQDCLPPINVIEWGGGMTSGPLSPGGTLSPGISTGTDLENVCQNGNCTNLPRTLDGVSNYSCDCDPGWKYNASTKACTDLVPCPEGSVGPNLLHGCSCDTPYYQGNGINITHSDCSPACVLHENDANPIGGRFDTRRRTYWYDMESLRLICDPGYQGGGNYKCEINSSHYMMGNASCEPRACEEFLPNVQFPSQQPIRIYYQESIEVTCLPGYSGGGLYYCQSNGVLYGGTNCTRAYCDVQSSQVCRVFVESYTRFPTRTEKIFETPPQVPHSDFDTAIQHYLPYPSHGLEINVICDAGYVGGGSYVCDERTNQFVGRACVRNYCDVPTIANSDFASVIQPYLPYPSYDLTVNVTCDAEYEGGGLWLCNRVTGTSSSY